MNKFSFKFDENYELSSNIIDGKFNEWIYGKVLPKKKEVFNSKVNVFYNFYKPKSFDRYREIVFCFDKLLKNKNIDVVYVLCSDDLLIENEKLIKIKIDGQPRYRDFFNIIDFNTNESDINIILNSDCYIDEIGIDLIKNNISEDEAFVLSRWDILSLNPFKIEHFNKINNDTQGVSQDAWIFIGHPKNELDGNYKLGMAGCDNAISYEFHTSGYKVSNPSFSIKIYHYHLTNIRTYGDYGKGYDNREINRIQLPYKFVPSSFFPIVDTIEDEKDIVFYNHYHNGDIHYSREFIKDIMKKYKAKSFSYFFDLVHVGSENILKDINLTYKKNIPSEISFKDTLILIDNSVYINTWVGQQNRKLVDEIGINLEANYEFYKEVYRILDIDMEDMEYYIPTIDYKSFEIDKCNKFLKNYTNNLKILVCNGIVRSAQCENFDMNESIKEISNKYPDIIFILTDSKIRLKEKNIFYTDDITGQKFDLNEISYLSLSCDMIIGKSSGPYAFSMVKENLFNDKKTIICLSDKKEYEWYISETCKHIISDKYKNEELVKLISNEINLIKERKPRVAFTIILNGLHHLKHNDYAEYLTGIFDYWVIVEGAAKNKGSTSWCKEMPQNYHKKGESVDGTIEFIKDLCEKHNNIIFVKSNGIWWSKDDMVNKAIDEVKKITNNCFLWEIDIDEQWTYDQIIKSERELIKNGSKTGEFNVIQFVGENLVTEGKDWAGNPFIRLWNWCGEYFEKHEPPTLKTDDKSIVLLSEKMKHYSFYFEQDVKFKNDWYTDHEGLYDNWLKLKYENKFPQHITYLFPNFKGSENLENSNNLDCRIVRYNELNTKNSILNDFVDQVYVINLKRRQDRLKHITKEFNKLDISFKRVNAIDGRDLDLGDDIRSSQIGCLRSHVGIIKEALKNGYDKIAVFEDDIIFCDDFEKRFQYYSENIPDDWDIMYLGGTHYNKGGVEVKPFINKINGIYGCFAMLLNNKNNLFEKIIELTKLEQMAYDDYYCKILSSIFNTYLFVPFFVKTLDTKSDINENKNSFSYDEVNRYFKPTVDLPIDKLIEHYETKNTKFYKENILNEFVDNVYCINLIRREDKMEHILNQFKKIGLDSFRIIKGIDGQKLKITETEKRKGEIGCLRSHISILQDAIDKGYSKIAVFEDDVIFCDDFEKRFDYFKNNVPVDWEILYFGLDIPSLLNPVSMVKHMIYKVWRSNGSFAMILNNKNNLFQKIIDISTKEEKPIDVYIEMLYPKINAYVFLPFFVKILETKSDISDKNITIINDRFKETIQILNIVENKKPNIVEQPIIKTEKELCDEYLSSNVPFIIKHGPNIVFDSSNGRDNIFFFHDHFEVYGRPFSYRGMFITKK